MSEIEEVKRGPGRPPKVAPAEPEAKATVAMFPVKLLKHYRPRGDYKVTFAAPPPVPGVSGESRDKDGNVIGVKLWADTVVELPRDEVVRLLENQGERVESMLDGAGRVIGKHTVRFEFPLAKRADALPV